jgi:BioD-like phosphotransacetylase family protein
MLKEVNKMKVYLCSEKGCCPSVEIGDNEEFEELIKKIKAKDLREEAEKRGIKTSCVKKIDIAKQLPKEVLEELSSD